VIINGKVDVSGALKVARTAGKQIRYAAARSLTDAAEDYAKVITTIMPQSLNQPTPFTLRGVRFRRATANTLQSAVYVMPIQAGYLIHQVDGGSVSEQKPAPTPIAENQYGNLPRSATKRAKVFTTRSRRTNKLLTYQRMGGKRRKRLRLLAVESTVRRYSKRWPFYDRARTRVPVIINRVFSRHLQAALAGARW